MSALETGLLQEEEDLGCWKHWCKTKKERDHQLCVWGSILVVALIAWIIVLSVMVFQLKGNHAYDDRRIQATEQSIGNIQESITYLQWCAHC